nr:hypothetical protein [Tanacetum cinerariifolium]
MVAILEKGEFNTDFHPMVDFIAASPLRIETTDEGTHILATMDAIVLAGGIDVPTGSGSIPTVGPPATDISTSSEVAPTASPIVTSYSRRKGKEVMVESDTPNKQRF